MQAKRCVVCGDVKPEKCHVKTKGSGGTMDDENILLMCRKHHQEQHSLGFAHFVERYPIVGYELKKKGWEFKEEFGVMRLRRK